MFRVLAFIFPLLFALAHPTQATPRLGTVDFAEIIVKSKAAADLRTKIAEVQGQIASSAEPRRDAVEQFQARGEKLAAELRNPSTSQERRTELESQNRAFQAEWQDLRAELSKFQERSTQTLLKTYEAERAALLEELRNEVAKVAQAEGIDWLFDLSSQSNSRLPAVLYVKNPIDITEKVLSVIELAPEGTEDSPSEPPSEPAPPAPEPAPASTEATPESQ